MRTQHNPPLLLYHHQWSWACKLVGMVGQTVGYHFSIKGKKKKQNFSLSTFHFDIINLVEYHKKCIITKQLFLVRFALLLVERTTPNDRSQLRECFKNSFKNLLWGSTFKKRFAKPIFLSYRYKQVTRCGIKTCK